MPTISMFYGILIRMYYDDHNPAHFHAYYNNYEAIFDLNEIENMERGTYYRYSSEIIVRDKNGKIISNVEIVPYQVTGKLQVDKK